MTAKLEFRNDEDAPVFYALDRMTADDLSGMPPRDAAIAAALMRYALQIIESSS